MREPRNSINVSLIGTAILVAIFLFFLGATVDAKTVVLTPDNHVYLKGGIGESEGFIIDLFNISNKVPADGVIYIVIDSPGGSVLAANNMVEAMDSIPQKIETVSLFAASAAFHIALMGDKRYVTKYSTMMQHLGFFGYSGTLPKAKKLIHWIDLLFDHWIEIESSILNMPKDVFFETIRDDWYIYGEEAVSLKVVDEVITIKCTHNLLSTVKKKTVMGFFGPEVIEYNACPLVK